MDSPVVRAYFCLHCIAGSTPGPSCGLNARLSSRFGLSNSCQLLLGLSSVASSDCSFLLESESTQSSQLRLTGGSPAFCLRRCLGNLRLLWNWDDGHGGDALVESICGSWSVGFLLDSSIGVQCCWFLLYKTCSSNRINGLWCVPEHPVLTNSTAVNACHR